MLVSLKIRNFALIEHADLDFRPGFTVITGETGSGKSILLGALNLILGERADYGVIRNPEEKTLAEVAFQVKGFGLEDFFAENDLDYSDETLIRREITAQGRSRAFVNDTPVQLNVLKELTEKLVHIHSQHHTLELKNPRFQLDVLDALSGNMALRSHLKELYREWKSQNALLVEKKARYARLLQDADYNHFQWDELNALRLDAVNYSEIENELLTFDRMEDIRTGFGLIRQYISEDQSAADLLSSLKAQLERMQHLHPLLSELSGRINASLVELKDISEEAENQLDVLESDPEKQATLTAQMDAYNHALRKHQAADQQELQTIFKKLSESQADTADLEREIESMQIRVAALTEEVEQKAQALHATRHEKAPEVAARLMRVLDELKLSGATVEFALDRSASIDETGFSQLTLLFAPNAGISAKPIEKAASGGELSRFMLALQLLLSAEKQLPTVLFDEIDTGVSGEVAQRIGNVLRKMGEQMQVLAITHLPQVAGKGMHHWKVQKSSGAGATRTEVHVLSEEERVREIARLMSGENINEAALENAKTLMN